MTKYCTDAVCHDKDLNPLLVHDKDGNDRDTETLCDEKNSVESVCRMAKARRHLTGTVQRR